MDGLVGLIIFAVVSFIYNKIMEKQNQQHGDADLSKWLEEAEEQAEAEVVPENPVVEAVPAKSKTLTAPAEPLIKKDNASLAQMADSQKSFLSVPKLDTPLSSLHSPPQTETGSQKSIQNKNEQTPHNQGFTKTKTKKRHSLNYKNKKTLRQAFILNTVLSKAKAYEP
jgi:hypothetical protein